ncbi:MAG: hypothetical protein JXA67_20095 [Micromonosporaceae bacterium]|nr:hypothetical protein [Micromonosporaceae bacterium]
MYVQSVRCLDLIERALREAGAGLADVIRTRVMLVDLTGWSEAARAHGERFSQVRPACTFVEAGAGPRPFPAAAVHGLIHVIHVIQDIPGGGRGRSTGGVD